MRLLDRFLTTNELDAPVSAFLVLLGLFTFILVFDYRGGFDGTPGAPGSPGAVVTATKTVHERTRRAGSVSVSQASPRPDRPISTRTRTPVARQPTTTPEPVITVRPRPRPTSIPRPTPTVVPSPSVSTPSAPESTTPVIPDPSKTGS